MNEQSPVAGAPGEFSQVFIYRVPKASRDRFRAVEGELATLFVKHGVLASDCYVVGEGRIFQGFRDLREVLGATPDEDVWVEIDHYRDEVDSAHVVGEIGQDPAAGPLFGEVLQLAVAGFVSPQANAVRVHP